MTKINLFLYVWQLSEFEYVHDKLSNTFIRVSCNNVEGKETERIWIDKDADFNTIKTQLRNSTVISNGIKGAITYMERGRGFFSLMTSFFKWEPIIDIEYTVKGISRILTISSKRDKVLFVTRERNLIIHEETYLKGFFELIIGNYLSAMFNRFATSLKAPSAIDDSSIN